MKRLRTQHGRLTCGLIVTLIFFATYTLLENSGTRLKEFYRKKNILPIVRLAVSKNTKHNHINWHVGILTCNMVMAGISCHICGTVKGFIVAGCWPCMSVFCVK